MTTETAKIPLSMPALSPMAPGESTLMAFHTAAVGKDTGATRSRPTMTRSGSSGYDGTSDPGSPGEPV
jgi:hypothetical protein